MRLKVLLGVGCFTLFVATAGVAGDNDEPFHSQIDRDFREYQSLYVAVRMHGQATQLQQEKWEARHSRLTFDARIASGDEDPAVGTLSARVGNWLVDELTLIVQDTGQLVQSLSGSTATAKQLDTWRRNAQTILRIHKDFGSLHPAPMSGLALLGHCYYDKYSRGMARRFAYAASASSRSEAAEGGRSAAFFWQVRPHDRAWAAAELAELRRALTPGRLASMRSATGAALRPAAARAVDSYRLALEVAEKKGRKQDEADEGLWSSIERARTLVMLGHAYDWGRGPPAQGGK